MSNDEKLASLPRLYLFHREGGFYPVQIPEATLEDNIRANPGTLRVDQFLGSCVWTAADGWLNRSGGAPVVLGTMTDGDASC